MKWWYIALSVLIIGIIGWLVKYTLTPMPGVRYPAQGRDHVSLAEVDKFKYNSNPPTSGPHVATWVKPGVYKEPQSKAELIHSLEHGYITVFYDCNPGKSVTTVSLDCQILVKQLEDLLRKKGLKKLLLAPYPGLDTRIALVAWEYLDKFNNFDAGRIRRFIDFYRDHGPEQTME